MYNVIEVVCVEVWKDIEGYEGIYQASSYGRIRTVDKKETYTKMHGKRVWQSRVMKYRGETYRTGYRVSLWKYGKPKDYLVARLVAYTFNGGNYNDRTLTVNHKDGNRLNNHIDNLEIVSLADNIRHAFATKLIKTGFVTILEKNGQVLEFISMSKASQYLGKTKGFISMLLSRNKKSYSGYKITIKAKEEAECIKENIE